MKSVILISALLLVGCEDYHTPVAVESTNNGPVTQYTSEKPNPVTAVDKLFTHGNCTIYRFQDNGYDRYYAECINNGVEEKANVTGNVMCGKGCSLDTNTPTN